MDDVSVSATRSLGSAWSREQQAATDTDLGRRIYTPLEDHRIVMMLSEGRAMLEIALELGRTWFSVQARTKRLRAMGLVPPWPRPPA